MFADASSVDQLPPLSLMKDSAAQRPDLSLKANKVDMNVSSNAFGRSEEEAGLPQRDQAQVVQHGTEMSEEQSREHSDITNSVVQKESPKEPEQTTDIVETPTRVEQKGLLHAVFSVQHRGKKNGCRVS